MKDKPDITQIECPINLFQEQEKKMQAIIHNLNQTKIIDEKASYANELQKEINVLLECKSYDENNTNCKSCQTVAGLRQKVVGVVLKTQQVAEKFKR